MLTGVKTPEIQCLNGVIYACKMGLRSVMDVKFSMSLCLMLCFCQPRITITAGSKQKIMRNRLATSKEFVPYSECRTRRAQRVRRFGRRSRGGET
jgi:hypothetical protein